MPMSRGGRWSWLFLALTAGGVSAATVVPASLVDGTFVSRADPLAWSFSRRGQHWDLDWTGVLRTALAGVDAVDVSAVDFGEPSEGGANEVLRIEGREDLAALVLALEVDPEESGDLCLCVGQWTLRFHRDGVPVASLLIKHFERLGPGFPGWPGEGVLTPESVEVLVRWLDARGRPELLAGWLENRRAK